MVRWGDIFSIRVECGREGPTLLAFAVGLWVGTKINKTKLLWVCVHPKCCVCVVFLCSPVCAYTVRYCITFKIMATTRQKSFMSLSWRNGELMHPHAVRPLQYPSIIHGNPSIVSTFTREQDTRMKGRREGGTTCEVEI